ncbi:hypothetical protein CRUP_016777 [Coryphaenoides rupestris]|nr:hypothetical protein CRUP_016777 [Coryphaenoides rupestris]
MRGEEEEKKRRQSASDTPEPRPLAGDITALREEALKVLLTETRFSALLLSSVLEQVVDIRGKRETPQRCSRGTLQAMSPAHGCSETVQVTLCSLGQAVSGAPEGPGPLGAGCVVLGPQRSFCFVQDVYLDMAQLLVSTAGRVDGLEQTLQLDRCGIPEAESERLDEALGPALQHLMLPPGWSLLGGRDGGGVAEGERDPEVRVTGSGGGQVEGRIRAGPDMGVTLSSQSSVTSDSAELPSEEGRREEEEEEESAGHDDKQATGEDDVMQEVMSERQGEWSLGTHTLEPSRQEEEVEEEEEEGALLSPALPETPDPERPGAEPGEGLPSSSIGSLGGAAETPGTEEEEAWAQSHPEPDLETKLSDPRDLKTALRPEPSKWTVNPGTNQTTSAVEDEGDRTKPSREIKDMSGTRGSDPSGEHNVAGSEVTGQDEDIRTTLDQESPGAALQLEGDGEDAGTVIGPSAELLQEALSTAGTRSVCCVATRSRRGEAVRHNIRPMLPRCLGCVLDKGVGQTVRWCLKWVEPQGSD